MCVGTCCRRLFVAVGVAKKACPENCLTAQLRVLRDAVHADSGSQDDEKLFFFTKRMSSSSCNLVGTAGGGIVRVLCHQDVPASKGM